MELEKIILEQIKKNKLANFDYEFIVTQLAVLNNLPYEEIKKIVDKLFVSKKIKLKSNTNFEKFEKKSKVDRTEILL